MQEVEIVNFTPSSEPLFRVIYSPSSGRRKRALEVVGTLLCKVIRLDPFAPVSYYKLAPAFIYKNDVVLGQEYWDAQRDGGQLTITPVRKRVIK